MIRKAIFLAILFTAAGLVFAADTDGTKTERAIKGVLEDQKIKSMEALTIGPPPVEMELWPDGAPGAMKLTEEMTLNNNGILSNVETPTITLYQPPREKATGAAVVICPGGGYWILAVDHEGKQIAEWLNSIGVAGIVVKYRHKQFKHPIPLTDAQHAVSTVRYRAKEWGIDPKKIGILGFSAGGHLASSALTHFHNGKPDATDPIDKVSSRPDFGVLIYPVITFTQDFMHAGSRNNLLGNNPDPKLIEYMSSELQVTKDTPPTFLVHSTDDGAVPPQNSISFYLACKEAGVPAEMHIYLKGGHGYGMRPESCVAARDWPGRCKAWMKEIGILEKN